MRTVAKFNRNDDVLYTLSMASIICVKKCKEISNSISLHTFGK